MVDKDTKADSNIIDCAKRIREYCTYGKCDNCVLHRNGRCFTQPEIDWDLD